MKAYKVFRWVLKASALTTVMFIMQACYGSPFEMEMRRVSNEKTESDTLVSSEDLEFFGFDNEDGQSGDDPIIP